jgi:hypothetical protein
VREERILRELRERIRDVRQGPDGFVYLLTDSAEVQGILCLAQRRHRSLSRTCRLHLRLCADYSACVTG